jgi:hypothetical protein
MGRSATFSLRRAVLALLPVAVSSAALAGPTEVGRIHPGEDRPQQILSSVYGGTFQRNGLDLTNGLITARRVADGDLANPADGPTDQLWTLSDFTVRAVAKFSMFSQELRLKDGTGRQTWLFSASGYGYDAAGDGRFPGSATRAQFIRTGSTGTQSSAAIENLDGRDHLITYAMDGLPDADGQDVYMMFWEDLSTARVDPMRRTASDYNDLAVELRGASAAAAVPLPAGVWGAALLGVMAWASIGGKKRRRAGSYRTRS